MTLPASPRLPAESARAYAAFVVYRDMGVGRSLEKTQQRLNKTPSYIRVLGEWSRRHEWVDRAAEWDAQQQAEREAQDARMRDDKWMQDRRKAQESRRAIINALDGMFKRIITTQGYKPDERQLKDLATTAKLIFQESRLEFGEPTSITDTRMSGALGVKNVNEMTDQELADFIAQSRP